jgi:polyhydroxyalkanoate synthesis regulator phasin
MLKELLYTGIGAATLVKERVEEEVKKLEESGKINTEDAKKFLESVETKGKEEEERMKTMIKDSLREIIDELNIATKEDIEKLKEELASKA